MGIDTRRLRIVSALGLGQLIAFGTSLYLLTSLARPIARDTHWDLAWIVGGYSIGTLVSATVSAQSGRFVGAGQGRLVLCLSALLFAAGLGLVAISPNLPIYCLAWAVIGTAMGTGLYDVAFGTAGRLFGATARAAIIQIALWGGFASTVFWPLSHALEGVIGWRATCLVFAALHLAVCLPLYAFAVSVPPDAAPVRGAPLPRAQVAVGEGWLYAVMGGVVTLEMAIVAVMSVHMQALLTGRGLTLATAVSLSALVGPSQVGARLLELTVGRRWPAYLSLVSGVVAVTAGIVLISLVPAMALPALMLYGAGLGVVSITSGTVPLLVFGPERYPPLMGRIRRIGSVVQAFAPFLAAALLTRFGVPALLGILLAMAAICLAASLILARLCRKRLSQV
ncbi:hypothetical protein [Asticcacaulis solisilvae]|uniref:hypothetical protein n=1 Tax=Asticcacaulis solisilvae TaxID=1217274 RepID=UPI003FD72113